GIADYSALLLPALRDRIDVAVAEEGRRAPDADVALYHIGNDPDAHGWILDALHDRPGVVVLHEYVLHHLIAGTTIGRGNGRAYLDAMERDLGVAGRLLALGVLDNLLPLLWETQPERFPLSGVVLDRATGLIVHSRYVAERARAAGYRGRLWQIPHPTWPSAQVVPAADVTGDPLIGCFGYLNMNKRIPQLLEAFAAFRRDRPGPRLALAVAADHGTSLGASARSYVEREHALATVADSYVAALEIAAGGDAVDDAVLWRIAEAAAEVGLDDPRELAHAAWAAGIVT